MATIGLIFDTETGNTNRIGVLIANAFPPNCVEVFSAAEVTAELLQSYSAWIFGTPSMSHGKLADNWQIFIEEEPYDLSDKVVALYGLGDQTNYPDEFADGLGVLYEQVVKSGAKVVGSWPTEDYSFKKSRAVIDGHFVGLVIDEDNQANLTKERISRWVESIQDLLS